MNCSTPGFLSFTISQSLLKLMSIEAAMPSNRLILCRPFLLLPSIFPSIRVFSNESALRIGGQSIGAAASASVFPMSIQGLFPLELIGLISLQSKGLSRVFSNMLKASVLWCSAFYMVQHSHPYLTTGKTIAMTEQTFVGKVTEIEDISSTWVLLPFFPPVASSEQSWAREDCRMPCPCQAAL